MIWRCCTSSGDFRRIVMLACSSEDSEPIYALSFPGSRCYASPHHSNKNSAKLQPPLPIAQTSATIASMNRRTLLQSLPTAALLPSTAWAASAASESSTRGGSAPPQSSTTVYELRVYHTYEGKLDDLLRRFREHTMQLFEKHGIKNIAYWTPTDDPLKGKTLVYIISHPSREAATANWKAFQDDPEWKQVRDASEANGKIVEKVDSTFLTLTDFSPPLR
jgi:hypothetical protein